MKTETATIYNAVIRTDDTITEDALDQAWAILQGAIHVTSNSDDKPVLLKQRESADLLNVSRQTIKNMTDAGLLHPVVIKEGKEYESEAPDGSKFKRRSDIVRYRRDEIEGLIR